MIQLSTNLGPHFQEPRQTFRTGNSSSNSTHDACSDRQPKGKEMVYVSRKKPVCKQVASTDTIQRHLPSKDLGNRSVFLKISNSGED